MKIEKINDRQIRCVLTKEELENRKIKLSELVSGSEKARGLLRDMMVQASKELGFSFNNNPLMIEAVPTGKDQLVLIITRVDDPGELDKRFGHMSGFGDSDKKDSDLSQALSLTGADDILNVLRRFKKRLEEKKGLVSPEGSLSDSGLSEVSGQDSSLKDIFGMDDFGADVSGKTETGTAGNSGKEKVRTGRKKAEKSGRELEKEIYQYTRFYLFRNLENVLSAAKRVPENYKGENSLYKNPDDGAYYLLVKKMDTNPEQFNRICNVLSEYSMPMDYSNGMDEFFREHMRVIVADHAMQHLRMV